MNAVVAIKIDPVELRLIREAVTVYRQVLVNQHLLDREALQDVAIPEWSERDARIRELRLLLGAL